MNPWPGTVLVALIVVIIVIAGANSDGDAAADAAAPTSSSSPTGSGASEPTQQAGSDGVPADGGAEVSSSAAQAAQGVALTFDDGPHPEYTPRILDILAERDARAVFCVLGVQVDKHPELVRRIVDEGHVLCNHSYDHDARLKDRSDSEIEADLMRTEKAIKKAAPGAVVSYFRQPMMFVADNVAAVAQAMDYRPLNWSIDTRDWEQPGKRAIVSTVEDHLKAGAIIIMHDGGGDREDTVRALPGVLDAIDEAGLDVVIPDRPFTAELVTSHLKSLW